MSRCSVDTDMMGDIRTGQIDYSISLPLISLQIDAVQPELGLMFSTPRRWRSKIAELERAKKQRTTRGERVTKINHRSFRWNKPRRRGQELKIFWRRKKDGGDDGVVGVGVYQLLRLHSCLVVLHLLTTTSSTWFPPHHVTDSYSSCFSPCLRGSGCPSGEIPGS